MRPVLTKPTPIKGVVIITKNEGVDEQIRLLRQSSVAMTFKSCVDAERYFDRGLGEVDIIYIDIDSVEPPVPLMAYMIGLWNRHFKQSIFIVSESVEKLIATGVAKEHFVVYPLSALR
jgi:hypothetical protein